jgi:hypothetical protein
LIGAGFVGVTQRASSDRAGGVFGGKVEHMRVQPLYREDGAGTAMREIRCAAASSASCFAAR